jgi:hypothetical protein
MVESLEARKRDLIERVKSVEVDGHLHVAEEQMSYIRREMAKLKKEDGALIPDELLEKLKQMEQNIHDTRSIALRL